MKELDDHLETFEKDVFIIFDERIDDIETFLADWKPSRNLEDVEYAY